MVDPAKTMISPFYNVSADVGNLTKCFFGEPTFKYLNPFAEGSGLGAELQPASQFYASSGATTPSIVPEAGASEMDSTTTTETTKKDDTSENQSS